MLMLQKNESSKYPGTWEFPGGQIETGESDKDAVIREVLEETGIDLSGIEIQKLQKSYSYSFNIKGSKYKRDVEFFKVRLKEKSFVKIVGNNGNASDNHKSYMWMDPEQYEFTKNYSIDNPEKTFNTISANSRVENIKEIL